MSRAPAYAKKERVESRSRGDAAYTFPFLLHPHLPDSIWWTTLLDGDSITLLFQPTGIKRERVLKQRRIASNTFEVTSFFLPMLDETYIYDQVIMSVWNVNPKLRSTSFVRRDKSEFTSAYNWSDRGLRPILRMPVVCWIQDRRLKLPPIL